MRTLARRQVIALAGAAAGSLLGCSKDEEQHPQKDQPQAPKTSAAPSGSGPAGAPAPQKEWLVGSFLCLTGGDAKFGLEVKQGVDLAVEEVNAAGGVRGGRIKVIYEDTKSASNDVTMQVEQLIDRDKVVALIGEVATSRSIPAADVANIRKVPMIAPSATGYEVTRARDYVFRTCFLDETQATLAADFIHDTLKLTEASVVYAQDDLYSHELGSAFIKRFTERGAKVTLERSFAMMEKNFQRLAEELAKTKPKVVYAPLYYKQMLALHKQASEEGATPTWLGPDGWAGEVELYGALENAYFTDHYVADMPYEPSTKLRAAYEAAHKSAPSSLAALGYDAVLVLADAIRRAAVETPQGIRDALLTTKDVPGATGPIAIGPDRNAQKPVIVSQIKNKKPTFFAAMGPGSERIRRP